MAQRPALNAVGAGSEADIQEAIALCQGLAKMKNQADPLEWGGAHSRGWIHILDSQMLHVASDGHCLFAAFRCSLCNDYVGTLAKVTEHEKDC